MNKLIEKAVDDLRLAMMNADRLTLEDLSADELSYGHTSGLVENKSQFIDAIVGENKRDVFNKIDLTDQSIVTSDSVAIVRHRFQAEVVVNGELMTPDIRVLQVWYQKEGKWKIIARQAYKSTI